MTTQDHQETLTPARDLIDRAALLKAVDQEGVKNPDVGYLHGVAMALRVIDQFPAAPHDALIDQLAEAQMEYADCWHEGDRLREHIATIGQELREWQDYADQPKAREVGVKGTRWADGYRQGWIAARTMLRTKSTLLALLCAGDKAEAPPETHDSNGGDRG